MYNVFNQDIRVNSMFLGLSFMGELEVRWLLKLVPVLLLLTCDVFPVYWSQFKASYNGFAILKKFAMKRQDKPSL